MSPRYRMSVGFRTEHCCFDGVCQTFYSILKSAIDFANHYGTSPIFPSALISYTSSLCSLACLSFNGLGILISISAHFSSFPILFQRGSLLFPSDRLHRAGVYGLLVAGIAFILTDYPCLLIPQFKTSGQNAWVSAQHMPHNLLQVLTWFFLDFFKVLFCRSTNRTDPIIRLTFKAGARFYPAVRVACFRLINITANRISVFSHLLPPFCKIHPTRLPNHYCNPTLEFSLKPYDNHPEPWPSNS